MQSLPILYSLRQCPYAIRARMGLLLSQQSVILRDVNLKNKPTEMIAASAKATVPILVLNNANVIDQSLDIMLWALNKNDPENLLYSNQTNMLAEMLELINHNDQEFVESLKKYKAACRYHDIEKDIYRRHCEKHIHHLEQRLNQHKYIMGDTPSLVDYAILPFIRQFSRVERQWYLQAPYPLLQRWLTTQYEQPIFTKAMAKYSPWVKNDTPVLFGHIQNKTGDLKDS